ncbi:nose resistant to fluoxetine protein 6-like isoform X2 [Bradysia coprophila]|uniref:nose resistant to fluoxetine protein 6-like isoform X2 n=1 Tax=Bradysia coprophila TaxID=38358 RepID=UPI00187DB506|nr:nose resistant to fluoxetine protein 6-like isoform X2 [Bradysia coprophila]
MNLWLRPSFWFLSIIHILLNGADAQRHITNTTKFHRFSNELQTTLKPSSAARETYLASSSLLYGLLKKLNDSYVTDTCNEHLQMVYEGIQHQDIWAMKVLDSSAQFEPGFIFGNNFLLGSLKECQWLRGTHSVTLSKRFMRNMKTNLLESVGPFDLEYNVVYAEHDSPWQIQTEFLLTRKVLQIGLCLPKSCSSTDVWNITQNYFDEETVGFISQYELQPRVVRVKTLNVETNFFKKTSARLLGAFLFITLLLTLMSQTGSNTCQKHPESSCCHGMDDNNNDNSTDLVKAKEKEVSLPASLLKCFSIKDNFEFILSTKPSSESVPTVNGLKSIGCFLILIFHMNWFSHFSVHNPVMLFAYGEQPFYQWASTTPLIVDIFFTISGLLLSYNFLRNQKTLSTIRENSFWQNCKFFVKQIMHRYLRLTPLYIVVMGATEIATAYLHETSPFWIEDRNDLTCQNHWWRNLLYIQNLYPVKEFCLNWTWSLACEMQFFIIFTFMLFLYAKYPELTKKIFVALFVSFTVIVYFVAYRTKFEPAYDVMHELGDDMYTSPWTRILPYLIGVGSGWILLNRKDTLNIDKKSTNYLFLVAISIIAACHCSAINRGLSYKLAAPLITMIRIFYSGATAWIILASTSANSVPIAKFLNHTFFVHLNKLSYGIYLLNPVVVALVYGFKDDSEHFAPITLSVMSIGVSVIVYLLAFVSSLLFEVPYSRISSLLKNYKSKTL